jgi:uncharacterized cofD-like protein
MSLSDKKVVVIGGGTGSFTLLSSFKNYTHSITALVNMVDDGGSTGILRDELGVLPPGDIRQCLVALSNEPSLREVFNYRFDRGSLKGHALGNLFLTALEKMSGNFAEGVELASRILNITGSVEPITLTNVRLVANDKTGKEVKGQYEITDKELQVDHPKLWLEPEAVANPKALKAIKEADVIIIAPGNLYGSLAPALIVPGIGHALQRSNAKKVYVCNLVTKPGQTDNFTVKDFADEIERFAGGHFLDIVLYNTEKPNDDLLRKYAKDGECAVGYNVDILKHARYNAIGKNLISGTIWKNTNASDPIAHARTLIRHDAHTVANAILEHIL